MPRRHLELQASLHPIVLEPVGLTLVRTWEC